MKIKRYLLVKVDLIPASLQEGKLYVSRKYETSCHLCACGCGRKVVTPFTKGYWTLTIHWFRATLFPSIGNWAFPCESHYWIRNNRVIWAGSMSRATIRRNSQRHAVELQRLYKHPSVAEGQTAIEKPEYS